MIFFKDSVAITNARLLGALVKVLPPATAVPLLRYVPFSFFVNSSSVGFPNSSAIGTAWSQLISRMLQFLH